MSVPAAAAPWPSDDASADRRGQIRQPPAGEAAFTALFREHYTACLRLARRLVRDEGIAHDVVQDVFLAWWRTDGGGYRADRGEPSAWLSTLTRHKAVDAIRTSERHRRLIAAAMSAIPFRPEERLIDEAVWWELGRQSLAAALPTLTPPQREVLDLAYGHGLTQAQIAERLDIPLGTVKSRTHTGMLRLRAAISSTWTPTGPIPAPEPGPTDSSGRTSQGRQARVLRPEPSTGTVRDDIDLCAAALTRIASGEQQGSPDNATMIHEAAALIDKHGDAGMYGLVVALAHLAASHGALPHAPLRPEPAAEAQADLGAARRDTRHRRSA